MVHLHGIGARIASARMLALGSVAMILLIVASVWLPTPGPVVAADGTGAIDDFSRVVRAGWGSAPLGGAYAASSTSATLDVDGSAGQMAIAKPGGRVSVGPTGVWLRDVDVTFRIKSDKAADVASQVAVVIARRVGVGNEYQARMRFGANGGVYLSAFRVVGGTRRPLGSEVQAKGLAHMPNAYLQTRVQVEGVHPTFIRIKVWRHVDREPSNWALVVTDNAAPLNTAGSVALRAALPHISTNAPVQYSVDDLRVVAITAPGATEEASGTYAFDSFERSESGGWGSADSGGSYNVSGAAGDYSVANGSGRMNLPRAGAGRSAVLGDVVHRDFELRLQFRVDTLPSQGSIWVHGVARAGPGDNEYRVKARIRHDGAVFVSASRVVSARESIIGGETKLAFSYAPGAQWFLHGRITGVSPTTMSASAWPASAESPTSWLYVGSDSTPALQSAGATGLRAYVSSVAPNAPFAVSFQSYAVMPPTASPSTPPVPTATASPVPTATASPVPTATASPVPTATASPAPAATASPVPTATASPVPTATASPVPTATASPVPTATASPTPAAGNAFYVSSTGNDANSGTLSGPWRTLQKAADTVSAGATVFVRGGTYPGFTMRRSGTESAPITFSAFGSERPVIDGQDQVAYTIRLFGVQYVTLSGLTVQGGFAERQHGGGVMVENSSYVVVRGNLLRNNKAFGIRSQNSTYVTIDGNEMTGNAVGVHIGNMGQGTLVTNNRVHHNDRMMINTADVAGDDVGAEGIALVKTTGTVVVAGNLIWGNRALSYDYGYDGGAFSIYAASRWQIHDNITWDNRNVLETGTDAARTPCDGNSFTRNINYGATTVDRTVGMVLRCASNTMIANNTFHDTQYFVFDISHLRGSWGGSIEGLQIVNNVIWVASGKVYGIETDPLPSSVVIDYNLVYNSGSGYLATVVGRGGTTSLATLRSWTGFEVHGIQSDPFFMDALGHDYRLSPGSPAVDSGRYVVGVTEGSSGAGPDRGALELN